MNVFVLCTGRCGSVTFAKACSHITNYTTGHETRRNYIFRHRVNYPEDHIEIDSRLAFNLGRLEERYGQSAFYAHLTRNKNEVARSYLRKLEEKGQGTCRAWYEIIGRPAPRDVWITPYDMVDAMEANIKAFLRDKRHMNIRIEEAAIRFPAFLDAIGAEGNCGAALAEFDTHHNAAVAA